MRSIGSQWMRFRAKSIIKHKYIFINELNQRKNNSNKMYVVYVICCKRQM